MWKRVSVLVAWAAGHGSMRRTAIWDSNGVGVFQVRLDGFVYVTRRSDDDTAAHANPVTLAPAPTN